MDLQSEITALSKRLLAKGVTFEWKNVLITGGAGFLGSWLCDVLIEQGERVFCLDNLLSGKKENIAHLLHKETFRFIEQDVTVASLDDINEHIDFVFHFASRASPLEFDKFPIQILKANTLGTLATLEIAKSHNARYIFSSTSEVYGDPLVVPTPETYYGNVNTLGVRGCYDEAKRCGEAYIMAYRRQYGIDTRIVRIFNTYGPRMRSSGYYGRALPRFIAQALANEPVTIFGNGIQTRSFTYVADLLEGILLLASKDGLSGEAINIGDDHEIPIMELARKIVQMTGSSSVFTYTSPLQDDPKRRCPALDKARRLLGWQPAVSLDSGLKTTIAWFRQHKNP